MPLNDHFTQLRVQIIHHLALSYDTKKMFSFLNKCTIYEINEEQKTVIIAVPNEFVVTQIRKFFLDGLNDSIKECYNAQYNVELVVNTTVVWVELKTIFKEEKSKISSTALQPTSVEKVYLQHKSILTEYFWVLFDTKYQFSNFVVGPNNEFAYTILQSICDQPGEIHNPFFLHGHVGLGKTHLLQATGNQIILRYPEKTVVYLPTSKLVTEIIEWIKHNTVNKLLRKFDDVDVLILDDIQVIANKNACQDILLGLFNEFVAKKKQVIFSWDKPPRHLVNIEERLKTRFALGTLCEITQADFETRMAILYAKREARGEELDEESMTLIAQTITDNIRELEGVTNTLITKKQYLWWALTIDDVGNLLRSMWYEYRWQITNQQWSSPSSKKRSKEDEFTVLVESIAEYYGLSLEDILWESRKKEVVSARSIAMRVAKKNFWRTFEKIGWWFHKNHSSVIYTLEKMEHNLKDDASLQDDLRALGVAL